MRRGYRPEDYELTDAELRAMQTAQTAQGEGEAWGSGIGGLLGTVGGGLLGTALGPGVGTAAGATLGGAAGTAIGKAIGGHFGGETADKAMGVASAGERRRNRRLTEAEIRERAMDRLRSTA